MITLNKKKIVFLDFATLNYGGGCEINFMNFGKCLKIKGYDVAYISESMNTFHSDDPDVNERQEKLKNVIEEVLMS